MKKLTINKLVFLFFLTFIFFSCNRKIKENISIAYSFAKSPILGGNINLASFEIYVLKNDFKKDYRLTYNNWEDELQDMIDNKKIIYIPFKKYVFINNITIFNTKTFKKKIIEPINVVPEDTLVPFLKIITEARMLNKDEILLLQMYPKLKSIVIKYNIKNNRYERIIFGYYDYLRIVSKNLISVVYDNDKEWQIRGRIFIIDLIKKKIIKTINLNEMILDYKINQEQTKIYYKNANEELKEYDIKTKKKSILLKGITNFYYNEEKNKILFTRRKLGNPKIKELCIYDIKSKKIRKIFEKKGMFSHLVWK